MKRPFYRLVKTNPPTDSDFMSNVALGRTLGIAEPTVDVLAMWSGISAFAIEAQARAKQRRFPVLGRFVAELEVDDTELTVRQTGRDRGHHTLWGRPSMIAAGLQWVKPLSDLNREAVASEPEQNDVF